MATKKVVDESNILLKRIAHLMESLTVVDTARRQRIVVDSGTVTIGSGTVTTLTNFNLSTDSTFLREMHRTNYNTAVRAKLIDS